MSGLTEKQMARLTAHSPGGGVAHFMVDSCFSPQGDRDPRKGLGLNQEALATLDLGGSKIGCFIVRAEGVRRADRSLRAAGVGFVGSRGIRAGAVIDLEAASQSIAKAVEQAEAMAGCAVRAVRLVIPGAQTLVHRITTEVSIGHKPIQDHDTARAISSALAHIHQPHRKPIHILPLSWRVDQQSEIKDPRGLMGRVLGLELLVISINEGVFHGLINAARKAHLEVDAIISAPLASAVGVLEPDEAKLGAIVIDMGAGTTTLAVFKGGNCIHVDGLNIGGMHVTQDLARGLSTTLVGAERVKTLHGAAIASIHEDFETVSVPARGDESESGSITVPRSILKGVIAPRIEETFELLRERLRLSGLNLDSQMGVVLTGGASQLVGVREVAVRIFDRPCRLGRPVRVKSPLDASLGPSFAATIGASLRTVYGPFDVVSTRNIVEGRLGRKDAPKTQRGDMM